MSNLPVVHYFKKNQNMDSWGDFQWPLYIYNQGKQTRWIIIFPMFTWLLMDTHTHTHTIFGQTHITWIPEISELTSGASRWWQQGRVSQMLHHFEPQSNSSKCRYYVVKGNDGYLILIALNDFDMSEEREWILICVKCKVPESILTWVARRAPHILAKLLHEGSFSRHRLEHLGDPWWLIINKFNHYFPD